MTLQVCIACNKSSEKEICSDACIYGHAFNLIMALDTRPVMGKCICCQEIFYAYGSLFCSHYCFNIVEIVTRRRARSMQQYYCQKWNMDNWEGKLPKTKHTYRQAAFQNKENFIKNLTFSFH
jgi:hypothetical protein